ncbi:MAG: TlpA family protein disulfide reductase [Anaerorhabdus sp.]
MKKVITIITMFFVAGCSTPTTEITPTPTAEVTATPTPEITEGTSEVTEFPKADMSAYSLLTDENHVFQTISMETSVALTGSDTRVVIYYGYADCPFCQQAVPVLNEAAKEEGYTVYYVDIHSTEGSDQTAFESLFPYVESFLRLDEEGEPAFYVPMVMIAQNGKVEQVHIGLAPSATSATMTEEQKEELKSIYIEMFEDGK